MSITSCPIWGHRFPASGEVDHSDIEKRIYVDDSPRTGGGYVIPGVTGLLASSLLVEQKARLTTWLVDQRMQGNNRPEITESVVEYTKAKLPLLAHERADRLLRFISAQAKTVADSVSVDHDRHPTYAWSESVDWLEIRYLFNYLKDIGWIQGHTRHDGFDCVVTVDGHTRIAQQAANLDSSQAFVAMWFDDTMTNAYDQGIKPAIENAGYNSLRIDQKEHANKIDDEIIAEIRRSRFLVADFTQGSDGARGGVYYEAGFAHGLDRTVIFTCRQDAVETLHFDTNHYNHIVWTEPEELRDKLQNRILAVIGEGPEARRNP